MKNEKSIYCNDGGYIPFKKQEVDWAGNITGMAQQGMALGSAVGSMLPGPGTAIGAAAGMGAGLAAGAVKSWLDTDNVNAANKTNESNYINSLYRARNMREGGYLYGSNYSNTNYIHNTRPDGVKVDRTIPVSPPAPSRKPDTRVRCTCPGGGRIDVTCPIHGTGLEHGGFVTGAKVLVNKFGNGGPLGDSMIRPGRKEITSADIESLVKQGYAQNQTGYVNPAAGNHEQVTTQPPGSFIVPDNKTKQFKKEAKKAGVEVKKSVPLNNGTEPVLAQGSNDPDEPREIVVAPDDVAEIEAKTGKPISRFAPNAKAINDRYIVSRWGIKAKNPSEDYGNYLGRVMPSVRSYEFGGEVSADDPYADIFQQIKRMRNEGVPTQPEIQNNTVDLTNSNSRYQSFAQPVMPAQSSKSISLSNSLSRPARWQTENQLVNPGSGLPKFSREQATSNPMSNPSSSISNNEVPDAMKKVMLALAGINGLGSDPETPGEVPDPMSEYLQRANKINNISHLVGGGLRLGNMIWNMTRPFEPVEAPPQMLPQYNYTDIEGSRLTGQQGIDRSLNSALKASYENNAVNNMEVPILSNAASSYADNNTRAYLNRQQEMNTNRAQEVSVFNANKQAEYQNRANNTMAKQQFRQMKGQALGNDISGLEEVGRSYMNTNLRFNALNNAEKINKVYRLYLGAKTPEEMQKYGTLLQIMSNGEFKTKRNPIDGL